MVQVTTRTLYQEGNLTAAITAVTLSGAPGPVTLSGTWAGATVSQFMPGDAVTIDSWTANDSFYFNGQDVVFSIAGGGGTEDISIKWYRNKTPY